MRSGRVTHKRRKLLKTYIFLFQTLGASKPCLTRAASSQVADCQGARCAVPNAVKTLCNCPERLAAAFILNMLSMLDSSLWRHCGNAVGFSSAMLARCGHVTYFKNIKYL